MIERQTIDGREATISYFGADFEPAGRDAPFVKIVFDDGEVLFLTTDGPPLPDIAALTTQRADLENQLAALNAKIAEATAPKDPPGVREEAALWLHVISIVDATEMKVRDIIERSLANVAGLPHVKLAGAISATASVMRRLKALRTKAIKAAFRAARARLGNEKVYGKTLAVWAQMISAADAAGMEQAIRSGLLGGLSHVEIGRKVVGSSGLNGVDGVTEMTRHKLSHVARASIRQNRARVDGTA